MLRPQPQVEPCAAAPSGLQHGPIACLYLGGIWGCAAQFDAHEDETVAEPLGSAQHQQRENLRLRHHFCATDAACNAAAPVSQIGKADSQACFGTRFRAMLCMALSGGGLSRPWKQIKFAPIRGTIRLLFVVCLGRLGQRSLLDDLGVFNCGVFVYRRHTAGS